MWYWVNFVFNRFVLTVTERLMIVCYYCRVDRSRVGAIGADRAAAEWILRLGGSVKFKGFDHWNTDYNLLPSGLLWLEAIDATELAVTSNGLEHLGERLQCMARDYPQGVVNTSHDCAVAALDVNNLASSYRWADSLAVAIVQKVQILV